MRLFHTLRKGVANRDMRPRWRASGHCLIYVNFRTLGLQETDTRGVMAVKIPTIFVNALTSL